MARKRIAPESDGEGQVDRPAANRKRRSRSWSDLSPTAKRSTIAGAAVQLALLTAALRDIAHRRSTDIRGHKKVWVAVCFINFVGPAAYFLFGRRRSGNI
jgi:hypothetical protein